MLLGRFSKISRIRLNGFPSQHFLSMALPRSNPISCWGFNSPYEFAGSILPHPNQPELDSAAAILDPDSRIKRGEIGIGRCHLGVQMPG